MPARRKPEHLRVLEGQRPRTPMLLGPSAPEAPEWLPEVARAEWDRIVEVVQASHEGWLQQVDRGALSAYCMLWATFESAARDVAERGALVAGRSSADKARGPVGLVKNPSLQVMRDASVQMRAWAKELGFTPDARGRVDLGSPRERDLANRLLTGEDPFD